MLVAIQCGGYNIYDYIDLYYSVDMSYCDYIDPYYRSYDVEMNLIHNVDKSYCESSSSELIFLLLTKKKPPDTPKVKLIKSASES